MDVFIVYGQKCFLPIAKATIKRAWNLTSVWLKLSRSHTMSHHVTPCTGFKGDVTRDDSQGRFLAQRSVATTLLRHCFEWLQHCSTIATLCCAKNRRCESSRATFTFRHLLQNKFALADKFATCTDSVANSKTTLYFLQQLFASSNAAKQT